MNPSLSTPARMHTSPETTAIAAARATARSGSPFAAGTTTAAITAAREESGPSTRIRLGPNTA